MTVQSAGCFDGVIVPLVTPLDAEREVDRQGAAALTEHVVGGGVSALFLNGTTGEFPGLPVRHLTTLLDVVTSELRGRAQLLVGVGATTTRGVLSLMKELDDPKVDAWVVLTPYYLTLDQASLAEHFLAIGDHSTKPVFLYDIPQFTQNKLSVPTIARLVDHARILGIKDSSGDWQHFRELLAVRSPRFAVGQGDETQMARSLEQGADAIVPGIANLIPEVCVELASACRAGDVQRASGAQAAIDSARRMYQRVYWLTALKAALSLEGLCQPYCLEPIRTADAVVLEMTREALVV